MWIPQFSLALQGNWPEERSYNREHKNSFNILPLLKLFTEDWNPQNEKYLASRVYDDMCFCQQQQDWKLRSFKYWKKFKWVFLFSWSCLHFQSGLHFLILPKRYSLVSSQFARLLGLQISSSHGSLEGKSLQIKDKHLDFLLICHVYLPSFLAIKIQQNS